MRKDGAVYNGGVYSARRHADNLHGEKRGYDKAKNKGWKVRHGMRKNERLYAAKKSHYDQEVEMSKMVSGGVAFCHHCKGIDDVSNLNAILTVRCWCCRRVKNDSGGRVRVAGARSIIPDGGVVRAQKTISPNQKVTMDNESICIL